MRGLKKYVVTLPDTRRFYRRKRKWHVLQPRFLSTQENVTPDFEFHDLATTTAATNSNNLHTNSVGDSIVPAVDARQALREKVKFCAFLYQNFRCATRNHFLEILSHHMHVEAGGRMLRCLRDAPPRGPNFPQTATDFYRPYKFVIAFENSMSLHYASEKLWLALCAHTVPIYWGNLHMENYFNPERFINAFDFDGLESLARHVMRVHADDALYLRYLSAPSRTLRQEHPRFAGKKNSDRACMVQCQFKKTRARLQNRRALPLAQRRMFHREGLSRFASEGCDKIVEERLTIAGWPLQGGVSRRVKITSQRHVWPHPAFYAAVDMRGQLDVKD